MVAFNFLPSPDLFRNISKSESIKILVIDIYSQQLRPFVYFFHQQYFKILTVKVHIKNKKYLIFV